MESIEQPKTIKVYMLVKQSGMLFGTAGNASTINLGSGFYPSQTEAEHNRTMAVLSDNSSPTHTYKTNYHIFELEVPNPAYFG